MKTLVRLLLTSWLISVGLLGCGVKGKPLPPLTAPQIGRGKPTFASPSERVSIDELDRKNESDQIEKKEFPNDPFRRKQQDVE